jgi:hypothetical protein
VLRRTRRGAVTDLASVASRLGEAGVREQLQVFDDGLSRDDGALGQLRRGASESAAKTTDMSSLIER